MGFARTSPIQPKTHWTARSQVLTTRRRLSGGPSFFAPTILEGAVGSEVRTLVLCAWARPCWVSARCAAFIRVSSRAVEVLVRGEHRERKPGVSWHRTKAAAERIGPLAR